MQIASSVYQRYLLLLGLLAGLAGCSSADVASYAANQPKLVIEDFFSGKLTAHGIVKNRSGELIRYFNVEIDASWDEQGVGTLDEHFVFDDGEKQQRIWTLVRQTDGSFLASANDVSQAATMRLAGNALFMDYVLTLDYKGNPMDVVVEDKMYLVNPATIVNQSVMKKFGFKVGSVSLVIQKQVLG
ncbi:MULTISPECIES: DUF3833 domain-containing protein [unclassified Agarivorans]|uniref:DUF3833 domain-containing protein n=1 Tax=unclassified Agarivorans TaxID=2636026 RepID=UPI0026E13925|nr:MULTISPECIES: DUF3833 domain-containing protein [unclassified Agarivorans]MDO6685539.1 DUF3833 domain-containing protein [Agarivorans sp. 3_MG-2023]MDO6715925.1 DUF3833 domain-containing protein [Agarivorans sp. 2_MG-2023]